MNDPNSYTQKELEEMCGKMKAVSNTFYQGAVRTGVHPFIEFCGLMNEYIQICERASSSGIQFPFASEHNGEAIPIEPHEANYIAEKLRCIFGPTIDQNPEIKGIFKRAFFHEENVELR